MLKVGAVTEGVEATVYPCSLKLQKQGEWSTSSNP
jgi:hypothetical protein